MLSTIDLSFKIIKNVSKKIKVRVFKIVGVEVLSTPEWISLPTTVVVIVVVVVFFLENAHQDILIVSPQPTPPPPVLVNFFAKNKK